MYGLTKHGEVSICPTFSPAQNNCNHMRHYPTPHAAYAEVLPILLGEKRANIIIAKASGKPTPKSNNRKRASKYRRGGRPTGRLAAKQKTPRDVMPKVQITAKEIVKLPAKNFNATTVIKAPPNTNKNSLKEFEHLLVADGFEKAKEYLLTLPLNEIMVLGKNIKLSEKHLIYLCQELISNDFIEEKIKASHVEMMKSEIARLQKLRKAIDKINTPKIHKHSIDEVVIWANGTFGENSEKSNLVIKEFSKHKKIFEEHKNCISPDDCAEHLNVKSSVIHNLIENEKISYHVYEGNSYEILSKGIHIKSKDMITIDVLVKEVTTTTTIIEKIYHDEAPKNEIKENTNEESHLVKTTHIIKDSSQKIYPSKMSVPRGRRLELDELIDDVFNSPTLAHSSYRPLVKIKETNEVMPTWDVNEIELFIDQDEEGELIDFDPMDESIAEWHPGFGEQDIEEDLMEQKLEVEAFARLGMPTFNFKVKATSKPFRGGKKPPAINKGMKARGPKALAK